MRLLYSFSVLIFCLFCLEVNSGIAPRIIDGKEARSGQFSFAASIVADTTSERILCGGALISEEWILTSGVCTHNIVTASIILGSVSREGADVNRVTVTTSTTVPHPDFDVVTLQNDIGLIKLEEPVELTDAIQPIRLASMNLPTLLHPTVLGWGVISDDNLEYSNELNYVELNLLTNEDCQSTYGDQITDTVVCAKGASQGSGVGAACFGDGGGPLVVRPIGSSYLQHVGVVSFFAADGCELYPAGFTRTYPYVDWIKNVTNVA